MTNHARKELERRHLEAFLRITGLDSEVDSVVDTERPDFLVTMRSGKCIGVEHTQPRDEVHAAHEGLLGPLTKSLEVGLERENLNLWVHLTLPLQRAHSLALEPRSLQLLGKELLTLLCRARVAVRASWTEYSAEALAVHPDFEGIAEVHVSEGSRPIVTWGSQTLSERLGILQAAIQSKTEKLDDYRNNTSADEFWLLVVSGPGLGCMPSILATDFMYNNGYQEMYLTDEFEQHCFRLGS